MDKDPEERRKETHRQREGDPGEATNKGREENRRGQQVPPALETSEAREPSIREEPFPHEEEQPQDGLERTWWRRMFGG